MLSVLGDDAIFILITAIMGQSLLKTIVIKTQIVSKI